MTIRAAVMTAPHAPIEMRELPDPVVELGGVLLEGAALDAVATLAVTKAIITPA